MHPDSDRISLGTWCCFWLWVLLLGAFWLVVDRLRDARLQREWRDRVLAEAEKRAEELRRDE